ncbi:VOC family protein [Iningainema tapete]|uniref:VOC family protein n=1 Tax=Iningainema tapete TaxID=2806730 RepID=UPI00192D394A|nr:VOC family protein [Iningainema tapete]
MIFAKRSILNVVAAFVMGIVLATWSVTSNTPTQAQINPAQILAQTQSPALSSLQADHIMLRVPNFEQTMQWYKQKFGFKEVLRWKEPSLPSVDLAYLELNGFRLEILGGGKPQPRKAIASLSC